MKRCNKIRESRDKEFQPSASKVLTHGERVDYIAGAFVGRCVVCYVIFDVTTWVELVVTDVSLIDTREIVMKSSLIATLIFIQFQ